MNDRAWEAVLRHIPAAQQDQFSLVTTSGTEISLQSLLRIEADFVVAKGRLAGSQDQGRVFFIPYANIDYFGTSQPIKDEEFHQMFDDLQLPRLEPADVGQAVAPPVAPVAPVAPLPPGIVAVAPSQHGSGLRPPIRSEVLERYRSARTPGGPPSSGNLPRPNLP